MKPVLFLVGSIPIYTYGFMLACALLIAFLGVALLSRIRGVEPHMASDALFASFAAGLIGGRVYYVLFHLDYFSKHILEVFYLHQGGLTWYGALIGAFIALFIYSKALHVSMLSLTDVFAPFLALGQSLGRVGCFFNGCCQGIVLQENADLIHRIPIQLYESVAMLGIGLVLFYLYFKFKQVGVITFVYLLCHGVIRFVSEYYREAQPRIYSFTHAQIISFIFIGIATIWIVQTIVRHNAKNN